MCVRTNNVKELSEGKQKTFTMQKALKIKLVVQIHPKK